MLGGPESPEVNRVPTTEKKSECGDQEKDNSKESVVFRVLGQQSNHDQGNENELIAVIVFLDQTVYHIH